MAARWNVFSNNFDLVNALDAVVVGPAVSTDNAIVRFDGTTGKLIQNSGSTLSDSDLLSTGELNLSTVLNEIYGGTGQDSYEKGDILYASSENTLSKLPKGTNGQVLTLTSDVPAWAASGGGGSITWSEIVSATQSLSVANGYITNRGAGVTYTLPTTASLGDEIHLMGKQGLATISQNAGQQILNGSSSTTVGVGGSLTGTGAGDCIILVCITTDLVFRSRSVIGNWDVV